MRLPKDRVFFITGASGGIGRAVAIAFAKDGARVGLFARRSDKIEEVAKEIGDRAIAVPGDVGNRADVRKAMEKTVAHFGTIDGVIANAGVGLYASIVDLKDEDLDAVFRTNLVGALYTVQEAMPYLKRRRGSQVIFITSVLGKAGVPYTGAYSMSKYAMTAMADVLRQEVRKDGIDVIVVGPGMTATEFQKNAINRLPSGIPAKDNSGGWPAEKVATAILRASRRRKRETYLTLNGKLLVNLRYWSPSLADFGVRLVLGDRPAGKE